MMQNDDELYHYGVLGMKWGVRKATNQLATANATNNSAKRDKAVSSLNKHKQKSEAAVAKLKKKEPSLKKKADRAIEKTDVKAARYDQQAARYKIKAGSRFTSTSRSMQYMAKAARAEGNATALRSKSTRQKAALHKNQRMQELFNSGINNIDGALVGTGEAYTKALLKAEKKASN